METIERELSYKKFGGERVKEIVYFKELTGGQRLSLLKGQKIRTQPGQDKATIEVDLGENTERNQRLVYMSLVDANGKQVYTSLDKLQAEPESKLRALVKLAAEVHKEDDDAGNA